MNSPKPYTRNLNPKPRRLSPPGAWEMLGPQPPARPKKYDPFAVEDSEDEDEAAEGEEEVLLLAKNSEPWIPMLMLLARNFDIWRQTTLLLATSFDPRIQILLLLARRVPRRRRESLLPRLRGAAPRRRRRFCSARPSSSGPLAWAAAGPRATRQTGSAIHPPAGYRKVAD